MLSLILLQQQKFWDVEEKKVVETESGLCSSTYEAIFVSGSKFRSHTFSMKLSETWLTASKLRSFSFRMNLWARLTPLMLLLGLFSLCAVSQPAEDSVPPPPPPPPSGQSSDGSQTQEEDSEWGMNSIRDSFEAVSGYFDSVLEFMGGRDGVCQYRCRHGTWFHLLDGYL